MLQAFYAGAQVGKDAEGNAKPIEAAAPGAAPKELYVALTSDRGLCGAIHSSICKSIRNELLAKPNIDNVGIICVGDKSRAQISRYSIFYCILPPCMGLVKSLATLKYLINVGS